MPATGKKGYVIYDENGQAAVAAATAGGNAVNKTQMDAAIVSGTAGFVPITRTVNGHALSSNIVITAADVGAPTMLFFHASDSGNVTTGETDLYSDTTLANTFAADGAMIDAIYAGSWQSGTSTKQIRIYFAGDVIFDTGTLSLSLSSAWVANVRIVRQNSSSYRATVELTTEGAALAAYTSISGAGGHTWSTTNILKITGQAAGVGAATNDIIAQMGSVRLFPAPL